MNLQKFTSFRKTGYPGITRQNLHKGVGDFNALGNSEALNHHEIKDKSDYNPKIRLVRD